MTAEASVEAPAARGRSRSKLTACDQLAAVKPVMPRVKVTVPARSTQKLGSPLPSRWASTALTKGRSRRSSCNRRRPQMRITSARWPL